MAFPILAVIAQALSMSKNAGAQKVSSALSLANNIASRTKKDL